MLPAVEFYNYYHYIILKLKKENMEYYLGVLGRCLQNLPNCGLISDEYEDNYEDDTSTGCRALQCLAACYAYDLGGTIPYMRTVEDGDNKLNLALFAFYEACWPCMGLLQLCCCYKKEDIQRIPRRIAHVYAFPSASTRGPVEMHHLTPPQAPGSMGHASASHP